MKRTTLEKSLSKQYETLIANVSWLSTKKNASLATLSALEVYKTAIRKIGKGTGANTPRHRRDAQKTMEDAQYAVPC